MRIVDQPRRAAVIGATIATVIYGAVLSFVLPQQKSDQPPGTIYCTAGMATCMTSNGGQWHVLSATCPAGQSPRFVSVEARRCHSIMPAGFSAPLSVCSAACVR
jgi:hypothetical protein